jgi:transposase
VARVAPLRRTGPVPHLLRGGETIGIDETSAARGQDYITLFCDLDRPRVVYGTEDRDQATVGQFAQELAAHGGDPARVTEVCCDMSPGFIRGIGEHLPAAAITFDRYHLAQQLGQALDQVRRQEVRRRPELRGTRYLLLKLRLG